LWQVTRDSKNIQGIETSAGLSMKFFHEIHGWLLRSFKEIQGATALFEKLREVSNPSRGHPSVSNSNGLSS
jgi:hypothetical protein